MWVARLRRELTARWRASPRLQDRVTAASTFAVGAALDLIGFAGVVPWPWLPDRPPPWAYLGPLAVGCLALLVKRRHPVPVLGVVVLAVLADVALGGSLAIVLVLFDAMFAVGLYGSPRARAGQATAVFVIIGTTTVVTALATGNLRTTVGVGLQLIALLVLPLWWSANVRVQRELGELTAEQARREAVYAERTAMARELHDAVASHLSTTAIHSAAALALPPDPERDRAALRAVRESSLAALQEMRAMITVLRGGGDDTVVPAGLAQLPQAIEAARAGGLEVTAEVTPVDLPSVVDQAAYRIVSEALTNARKHAPGARVTVEVRPVGDQLALTVTNTLTTNPLTTNPLTTNPLTTNPLTTALTGADDRGVSAGTGLAGMRERASMVGGTLTAGREGDVWRVHARLPLGGGSDAGGGSDVGGGSDAGGAA